jgi:hypothetical protein
MTREEKINTLKVLIQECEEYQWQRKETLFEIIKDLEQEPVIDMIRAEIEELDYITFDGITKRRCLEIIDKYKANKERK